MANYDFTYTGAEIQAILDTAKKLKDSGYIFLGVATPSTNPGTPTQKVYYEAKQAGTYTNFGGAVLPDGLSLLIWNGSWTSETMMSGDGGVFDISVYKSTGGTLATFADLSAALNGGNNIPVGVRKGGMSVKFVQSSDNKYIQARCMSNEFTTDVTQWQGVDKTPVIGSHNMAEGSGIKEAINKVETLINDKSEYYESVNTTSWTELLDCNLQAGKIYRLSNIGELTIISVAFLTEGSITVTINVISGSVSSITANSPLIFSLNDNASKVKVRINGYAKAHFTLQLNENRITLLENREAENEVRIGKLGSETEQYLEGDASGWKEYSYIAYPQYSYTLKKTNAVGSITSIQAFNGSTSVSVTGFSNLSNEGDECTVQFANNITRFRIYSDGHSFFTICISKNTIERDVENKTAITTAQEDIDALEKVMRGGTTFSLGYGWSSYLNYSFKQGLQYTIYHEGGGGTIIGFEPRNGISYVTVTGFSSLSLGQSCVVTLNKDADNFRMYSDGGSSEIRIVEQSVDLYYDVRSLINTSESYSSKDSIVQRLYVSKYGTEGHYSSIADAYAAITDSSYINQYEVIVFPGKYIENNLTPPPFTHTHGLAPNSVVVSSEGYDTGLPVFDQAAACSKLSNMTIESHTGYCVHLTALAGKATVNENLILDKAATPNNTWYIIGCDGAMLGTKNVWKNCTFISRGGFGQATCHTSTNGIGDNLHFILESCSFTNCNPHNGSVGGYGHDVFELNNCVFRIGEKGLESFVSKIRNIDNPTLYRFKTNEWQVIGGGNKNLSMLQVLNGKTIRLVADYPITISGTAASVIFGYNPYLNNVKTARLDCTLTSEYYIDDSQAGYPPYSPATDVYQLWKRLGDCSTTNKTLSVTVNGVTKTYTFTADYLTDKTPQATIIAAMQVVLDNVTIEAITDSGYGYENVNTSDCMMMKVTAGDILKGELVTLSGGVATSSTPVSDIVGVACEDKPVNEYVKVWTSAFRFDADHADGEYGLDANGELDSSAATKVGFVKNNIFYRY